MSGTLYLVPTPLDFGESVVPLQAWLPGETMAVAARLSHWVVENAKSARAFLKRVDAEVGLAQPLQSQSMVELPRALHKQGDHRADAQTDALARSWLSPALQGRDMGLLSEAGMPAVADPGASVVRAAHGLGLRVVPLVGPVSLMQALAASGLNGQGFAFVGYVPQERAERARCVRELEQRALRQGQTQILIETPYRNTALLQGLLETLQPGTRLCVASALGLPGQTVFSAPVAQWRKQRPQGQGLALQAPSVFLLGV